MTWVSHIRIDPTMSSVGSSSTFWCLVHLNMCNNKVSRILSIHFTIRSSVFQQIYYTFCRIFWPTTLKSYKLLISYINLCLLTVIVLNCLAWAHLPIPLLNFLNGTHSFLFNTFFKYAFALISVMRRTAFAVSVSCLYLTVILDPLAFMISLPSYFFTE